MREVSTKLLVPFDEELALPHIVVRNASEDPRGIGYARREGATWAGVTHEEFLAQVETLAKGFMAAGVEAGDRVALMSTTRYEWTLTDLALLTCGAVVVPIYETSSSDQVAWILADSEAVAVVVENQEMALTVSQVRERCPHLRDVWQIDAGHLDELLEGAPEVSDAQMRARRDAVDADHVATIIYTSGTTGLPKGCVLTHGNFVSLSQNCLALMDDLVNGGEENNGTLLFLPLAHVFARLIQFVAIASRTRLAHTTIGTLVDDLGTYAPSYLLGVPRVFEKVYNSAEQRAQGDGRGKIFAAAADTAIAYSEATNAGRRAPLTLRVKHTVFDRLVYAKLRSAFGGHLRYSISGGAPLSARLAHFYNGIGLPVLEGYGLTETTAPACVNPPKALRIGTVGPACPGVGLRIDDDGEILVKGINVFREYLHNPEATDEAKVDGWFRTGDLGELDADGYLSITGRKKDILVTAGGKNVSPAKLEDSLRSHPLIAEAVVVGDAKPFIAALLCLDEEMLPGWASAHGITDLDPADAAQDQRVLDELQKAVDQANTLVSRAESIRAFRVLTTPLTQESGHLTPSLKVKRNVVLDDYADVIDSIYSSPRT